MTRRTPRQPEPSPFDVYLRKHGTCGICRERDTQTDRHGGKHCRGDWRRQHPTCTHDGRKPRFHIDTDAIRLITGGPHAN